MSDPPRRATQLSGRTDPVSLLEGVGHLEATRRISGAVGRVLTEKTALTPDLGGKATTRMVTEAVSQAILADNE